MSTMTTPRTRTYTPIGLEAAYNACIGPDPHVEERIRLGIETAYRADSLMAEFGLVPRHAELVEQWAAKYRKALQDESGAEWDDTVAHDRTDFAKESVFHYINESRRQIAKIEKYYGRRI